MGVNHYDVHVHVPVFRNISFYVIFFWWLIFHKTVSVVIWNYLYHSTLVMCIVFMHMFPIPFISLSVTFTCIRHAIDAAL